MNIRSILLILSFCSLFTNLTAQNIPVKPSETGSGVFLGATKPLRDIPELTAAEVQLLKVKSQEKAYNEELSVRAYPFADIALPKGPDAVWQKTIGKSASTNASASVFEGQSTSSYPPDCNGAAGPNHFMQTVNTTYTIFDKSGIKLVGPTSLSQLFNGVAGASCDDGDPIILYDEQADRWMVTEFSLCDSTDRILIAVSTTNDPTGTWFAYSFDVADMPDYPKFSVWQDGYYMADNNSSGNDIYVFERSKMIAGAGSPKFVGFNNAWRPGSVDGFMCTPPVDNDGAFAPAGSPGLFIAMSDDGFNSGTDQLWIYELAVNWTNTSTSTFNRVQQIDVTPFDSNFGNDWTNIKQLGTTQELDAIPQVIMNVPQYRNFGTYQTLVCCHSVDVDNTDHAGIRWYELRKTPPETAWFVRQQGTYAPDIHSRWMGSIMLNAYNEIGLGYSVSGATINPGIRYCGQTKAGYSNASGNLDLPEGIILSGTYSQTGAERWGDYSQMSVDPADNGTFWFTTEYAGISSRKSKIAAFQVGTLPPTGYFTADNTLPCINSSIVTFTSQVTGNPTQYSWVISPGTFTFSEGTSNSSVNPKVIFDAYGTYSVSLTVTSTDGTTTSSRTDYIKVNEVNANFKANSTTVVVDNSVTFVDGSTCGPTSWAWDFGEGASPLTANTQGPQTVLYKTTGPKTISLAINGAVTETKTGYINVVAPEINMSTSTISACSGSFYDPGGALSNYSNNQDFTMLFKPGIVGNKLQFVYTSFILETQATCTKDYLSIYDGNSVLSPLIGTYCGATSPGTVTATNEAGEMLFVFHSNSSTTRGGWAATIGCINFPVANPVSLLANAAGSNQVDLNWTKNADNNDVVLAWSPDGTFGTPVNGTSLTVGELLPGRGIILANGNGITFNHTGVNASTTYYYKAFSYDAKLKFSDGITSNATTLMVGVPSGIKSGLNGLTIYPNPAKGLFRIIVDKSKYPAMFVSVSDLHGAIVIARECKGESEYLFDLGKSPQGTYFVKIKTDKELVVSKLVIIK